MKFANLLKPVGHYETGNVRKFSHHIALFFEAVSFLILLFSAFWLVGKLVVFLYFNAMIIWGILALIWLFMFGLLVGFHRHCMGKLSLLNAVALWIAVIAINIGFAIFVYGKLPEQSFTDREDFGVLIWLVCHCAMILLALSALLEDLGVFDDYQEQILIISDLN